jgi:riboflavin kinase/FMN adenylyltransferase
MQILDDLTKASLRQETVLTIGAFDGVHCGHQALIGAVVERARKTDTLSGVVTFHPHPVVVLAPERAPRYLTTPGEKLALLEGLGIDLVVLLPFDRQMAALSPRLFMERVSTHLCLRELWVGADFSLGRNREGDLARLHELGRELGYDLIVYQKVLGGENAVSSSRIRALLREGRVEEAAALLGRYPRIAGEVMEGAGRGREPGHSTANLEVRPELAVPADGVYAVFAVLGRDRYPAVATIGVRPSSGRRARTVEIQIPDMDQGIDGCDLVVEFVSRLRDERRSEEIDELAKQVETDSQAARRILSQAEREIDGGNPDEDPVRFRFRELEHTADRALRVWGKRLADLFAGAARGMCSLMGDLEGLGPEIWRTIRLEATDLETLLVEWLNELLYLIETEGLLFVDCRVETVGEPAAVGDGAAGVTMVAHAGGATAPVTKAHIKATTFHNLELVEDATGWSTTITFDV